MNRTRITVSLDPNDLNEIRRMAKREDRSVSYVVNSLLREGLRNPVKAQKIIKRTKFKYAKN